MVVTVIAILAAMLLPALARVKSQAWRVACINNEKQMLLSWALYSVDARDALVTNGGNSAPTSPQAQLWVYGGNHGDPETLTNAQFLIGANYALFSPYVRNVEVYKCPADRSRWSVGGKLVLELRSYSLNSYLGTTPAEDLAPLSLNPAYRAYFKSAALAADSPAERFVFMDVNPGNICTPGFGVDMNLRAIIHYPSTLHNGLGVVSFADNHVESHKWRDPKTRRDLPDASGYIGHSDPVGTNQDILWIAARTTSHR